METVLQWLGAIYLLLAFIKFSVCLVEFHTFIGAYRKLTGRPIGIVLFAGAVSFVLVALMAPVTRLRHEGFQYFLVTPRRRVIRQTIEGVRLYERKRNA